ncbi:hypothetical protein [Yersinia pestis]|uniref:hypothetical protein n=1 Tax=Yersinia pestis TaxID=632 RepID=UPI002892CF36|nr:hypothetical protein [Yersinia pestis]
MHVGSSRAILGADALLLCLSSPFKIASSGFVSSLKDGLGHPFMVSQGMITDTELEHRNDSFT